jgi:1,2-phenylacetyl-CoA epoxidase PaaB subunit
MAKNPADEPHPRWEVSHIKGLPALIIGRVEAPDAESAIEEAMKRFELKERVRERLAARRVT